MPCLHNAVAVLERDERFRGVFGCDELQFSAAALSTLGACLAAAGSCPAARIERALLAASRASTRETAGYLPIENSFSLPSMRYFNRHNLPPAGGGRPNTGRPRLIACMPYRQAWRSLFSGRLGAFWGYFFRGICTIPLNIPRLFGRFNEMTLDGIRQENRKPKQPNQAESSALLGFGLPR